MMLLTMILVMLLLLVGRSADTASHIVPELPDEPVSTYSYELYDSKENNFYENLDDEDVPQIVHDEVYSPERCACGEHYIHEDLRFPTPPLVMREPQEWGTTLQHFQESFQQFQESLSQFENIHRITYHQFETEWHYYSFIIWTDEPLRDFFFASLDVARHYWYEDRQLVIGTREVIFEIDELLPGDAIIFDVAFSHYLLPHAGVGFTDSNGVHRRMFIEQSMRGGCGPWYVLAPLVDDGWAVWR